MVLVLCSTKVSLYFFLRRQQSLFLISAGSVSHGSGDRGPYTVQALLDKIMASN